MGYLISIDQAIKILEEYKTKGNDRVLLIESDKGTNISNRAKIISVNDGILVVSKTDGEVLYKENYIIKSLNTPRDKSKINTILFC